MLQAAEKTQEQPPKKASCLFSDLRVDLQVEEKSQKDCRVNVLAALSGHILGGHGKIHSATGVLYAPIHDTLESIAEAAVSFHQRSCFRNPGPYPSSLSARKPRPPGSPRPKIAGGFAQGGKGGRRAPEEEGVR